MHSCTNPRCLSDPSLSPPICCDVCTIALAAVEDLVLNHLHTELDSIDMANNITYYADGLDVYQGFIWKWEDGQGDLIERVYSAAETEDQLMVIEDPAKDTTDRSEPYSPPRKVNI